MSSIRPRRLTIALLALAFVMIAQSAFATHFRYGYMFWERDLSYFNPANPGQVKVTVTVEAGARWTYTWPNATSYPPGFTQPTRCLNNAAVCCAGVLSLASTFPDSCPSLGAMVNFSGSNGVQFSRAVTVVARHGYTLTTPLNIAAGGFLPMDVIANQIIPVLDTFYGRFSFTILMDTTGPLNVTWTNNARISQLLDSNNDRPWTLMSTIDFSGANIGLTKSPKSQISAVVQVFSGQNNVIALPSVAFDNLSTRWRIATSVESSLVNPTPLAPSIFTLNTATGVVNFTPRTTGFYAVQFRLVAFDPNTNLERASVPVDLMFESVPAGASYASTLNTTDGQSTYTATVGQPLNFTMRSTLTPNNTAYTTTITNTIAPTGAVLTGGTCIGTQTCDRQFSWTPTVTSTASVVCYNTSVTNGAVLITSAQQKCVTINLNALETRLQVEPAEGAAGGGPLQLKARLTRVIDGAPLPQRSVTFSYNANPTSPPWVGNATAVTDTNGWAVANLTTVGVVNPASPFTASFSAIAGELLASSTAGNVLSVKAAATAMNVPTLQPIPTIGYPITTSALLNRIHTDGGTLAVGADVQFTLAGGAGGNQTATGTTGATGVATATFPTIPTTSGPYTVQATFSGNDALFPNADGSPTTATTAPFTLRQRTQLAIQPLSAVVAIPTQVQVSLHALPALTTPLGNRAVQLSGAFSGSPMSAVTNASGVATFTNVTFAAEANAVLTASYTPTSSETNDEATAGNETATQSVPVTKGATQLALNSPPIAATVNQPLIVSATLTRTSAPSIPVNGATVSFTLTRPNGSVTLSATTNSSGVASFTFPATSISVVGQYSLQATFATTPSLAAASSAAQLFPVSTQTTTALLVSPVSTTSGQLTSFSALLTANGVPLVGSTVDFSVVGGASLGSAVTGANGVASLGMFAGNVFSGQYRADFAGGGAYTAATASAAYTVAPITTAVTVSPVTAVSGQNVTFSATVTAGGSPAHGLTVVFSTVGGGSLGSAASVGGVASITVAAGTVFSGQYKAEFVATGNLAGSSATAAYTINGIGTALAVSPVNAVAGQSTTLSATLTAGGSPLAGQSVSFSVVGVGTLGNATTNGAGVASFNHVFVAAGSGQYGAAFEGSPNHAASSANSSYTVAAATTALTLVSPPTTGAVGQPLQVSASLTRVSAPAGVVPGATIVFTLTTPSGSVQRSGVTVSNGVTTVNFPTLTERGAYALSASFAGDTVLAPSSSATTNVSVSQDLAVSVATSGGVAGAAIQFTATVNAMPAGTPVTDPLVVTFTAGSHTAQAPVSNGTATGSITFPNAGSQTVTASIAAGGGYAAAASSAVPFSVAPATVTLSALQLNDVSFVGDSNVITTTLTRTSAPSGPVGNTTVTFTVSGDASNPGGATQQTFTAVTDANGAAQINVPLSARGTFNVTASFAGSTSMANASRSASFQVFQKVTLLANAAHGVATDPTSISAGLMAVPGNTPIVGQTMNFDFAGVVPSASAITDGSGVAALSRTFALPGTYGVTASFENLAGFFVDENGQPLAATSTSQVIIQTVQTDLSTMSVPAALLVGDALTVSTVLTRITMPSGPLGGQPITFSLDGNPVETVTTDATGAASATIALPSHGTHTVTASFAGNTAIVPATTSTSFAVRQKVLLTASQPTVGTAGVTTNITATLVGTPGGAMGNQPVSFSAPGGVPATGTTNTNAAGVATFSVRFPAAGSFPVTATFVVQNNYANRNGDVADETSETTAVINKAAAQLTAVVAPATTFVGQSVTLQTTLSRVTSPAGPLAGAVNFAVTQPDGSTQVVTGQAGANGVATASFVPSARGVFSVIASFDGDASHDSATAAAASISSYQRTSLTTAATGGNAGALMSVIATLTSLPGDAPVDGQPVQFTFSGANAPPSATVTTVGGVASLNVTPSVAGTFTVQTSFMDAADFYADSTGAWPIVAETDATTFTVNAAVTALSALTAPANALIGAPISVSTTLTRADALPVGAGHTVNFTMTTPGGATVQLSGVTNAAGVATASFTPTARGVHTVVADFGGNGSLTAASSATSTTAVYQRTSLSVATATGSATKPMTISATLTDVPGGAPLSGQTVAFSFTNGSWATGTTNTQGVAQVTVTFAAIGDYTATATFSDAAGFYADSTGAFPVVATVGNGTVNVTNNPPTLNTPANIVAEATSAAGSVVTFTATGSDIEDGAIINNVVCTPASGSVFSLATTTVSCVVTDAAGATGDGSFTVTVRDTTAPSITAPASISVGTDTGATYAGPFGVATATDAVSNAAAITITHNAPAVFAIGTTTVVWTATDAAGNSASASHTVTVADDDAPSITAPGAINVGTNTGATYIGPFGTATATDNASSGTGLVITNNAPSAFPIGTTTVIWTATDEAGNATSAAQDVTVADDDAPSITAPDSINVGTNDGATYTGAIGLPTASDNASSGPGLVITNNAPAAFPLGTTTVVWTATDEAGNSSTASHTVTVADDDAPSITAPGNASFGTNTGATYTGEFGSATASDNASSAANITITNDAPATFPIGNTTVTWTAKDEAGNTASASHVITVADDDAPSITAPPNATVGTNTGATYTGEFGNATANDNASSIGNGLVISNNAPATFPMGNTTVTWTATDAAGNATSANQIVTVTDDDAPVLTAPAALTVGTNAGGTYVGAIGTATATDNVSSGAGITITDNRPAAFPLGNTTVTFTAVDEAGNVTTATQVVTVVDDDAPVVAYTGNAGTYTADQTINIICTATDAGSGIASTTCANVTGPAHTFAVGVNTRTATATDNAGNTASATITFTVTVPPAAVNNVITTMVDSPTEAAKMNATLNQATSAPNANARAAHLNKLKKDIEKEIGKTLTAAEAATLISLLNNLY